MIRNATPEPLRRVRCAVYTRKSSEEGLEQEFNSLDAQREAAQAYVASQKSEGWACLPARYDDGGYSGGSMERPALAKLLADVEAGRVDVVVVYKVDRLSRSLLDFTRIIEIFDRHGVSFVSVTQQFNTTTSMGRLTLNILLSFAQFEREIIGERIRDKVAAAKKKGKHTGGMPVLGYDIVNHKLVVNEKEAELVRHIFRRFLQLGSAVRLANELNAEGRRTKAWTTLKGRVNEGRPWNVGHIYRLLNNRTYNGEVVHKDKVYPGEHQAIVPRELWDEVQASLAGNYHSRANATRSETPAMLKGLVRCGHCGGSMGITFTKRHGRQYRYYLCVTAAKQGYDACPVKSVAAGEIEKAVLDQLRAVFRSPEMAAKVFRAAQGKTAEEIERLQAEKRQLVLEGQSTDRVRNVEAELRELRARPVNERDICQSLRDLDPVWAELFPAEQQRIARLLIESVTVSPEGLDLRIRADGLSSLLAELAPTHKETP
jgi:site-specific DNA recombinase